MFDDILKLPDVARPVMACQQLDCPIRDVVDGLALLPRELLNEVIR